jgi:hypothetical protein
VRRALLEELEEIEEQVGGCVSRSSSGCRSESGRADGSWPEGSAASVPSATRARALVR